MFSPVYLLSKIVCQKIFSGSNVLYIGVRHCAIAYIIIQGLTWVEINILALNSLLKSLTRLEMYIFYRTNWFTSKNEVQMKLNQLFLLTKFLFSGQNLSIIAKK